jgi:hypothetical protein
VRAEVDELGRGVHELGVILDELNCVAISVAEVRDRRLRKWLHGDLHDAFERLDDPYVDPGSGEPIAICGDSIGDPFKLARVEHERHATDASLAVGEAALRVLL